jgi:hypothetical protein
MPDPIVVVQHPVPGAKPAPDAPGLVVALMAAHAVPVSPDDAHGNAERMLKALADHGYAVSLADTRFDGMALYSFMYPYSPELLSEARATLYEAIADALDTEADRLREEVRGG